MKNARNGWSLIFRYGVAGVLVLAGLSGMLCAASGEAAETPGANILFILDASGSMWGRVEQTEKIVIAKEVLTELIRELPENVTIGLEVYGHRTKGDCNDIEMLVPVGQGEKEEILQHIQSISPKGKTPITKSIELAAQQLETLEAETTIVLVSDGKETCEGDPCERVKILKDKGIRFTMHVVGFDVTPEEKEQLACIAESGGGRYFTAQNATQLQAAFTEVKTEVIEKAEQSPQPAKQQKVVKLLPSTGSLSIPNIDARKVEVYTQDAEGKDEYSEGFIGRISSKEPVLEVLAGTYKLKFGKRFFVENVAVESGETVEIQLGSLAIPNLTGRKMEVHAQQFSGKDEYTDGFVGWLRPEASTLEVPAGTYKLKFGNNAFVEGIEVSAGAPTKILVGTLAIPNLTGRKMEVHVQQFSGKDEYTDGFVGWLKPEASALELPAGTYKLKFGNNAFVEGIEVGAGAPTEILVGTLAIPNLTDRKVEVHAQPFSGKDEYADGFVGWLKPDSTSLEVPTGTYKLKFGNNVFVEGLEVGAGAPTTVEVGAIRISNLDYDLEVYAQDSEGNDQYSDGFLGRLRAKSPFLEVPEGLYKLKFGKQFMENVAVEAGQEVVLE